MTTTPTTRRDRRAALRAQTGRIITPTLRRWAYGVAAAAIGLGVAVGWIDPKIAPVILPLVMAALMVDETGEPTEGS
jgi:hypothetical protein